MFEEDRGHMLGAGRSEGYASMFCGWRYEDAWSASDESHHSDIAVIDGEQMSLKLVDAEERSSRSPVGPPDRVPNAPNSSLIRLLQPSGHFDCLFCANRHVYVFEKWPEKELHSGTGNEDGQGCYASER